MLKDLVLSNFIIIDNIDINFNTGLSIITGETGAGKSIILDAIGIALGSKYSKDFIQDGKEKSQIIATFSLQKEIVNSIYINNKDELDDSNSENLSSFLTEKNIELEFDDEENLQLIIRRSINKNGGTKNYINDTPIGTTLLKQIGSILLEIHGQFDNQNLLNPKYHRGILDSFIEDNIKINVEKKYLEYKNAYNKYKKHLSEIKELEKDKSYRDFILEELEEADIKEDEENQLLHKKTLFAKSEEINSNLDNACKLLNHDKILYDLNKVINSVEKLEDYFENNEDYTKLKDLLNDTFSNLTICEELLYDIKANSDDNNVDIDDIEERIILIRGLAKKHKVLSSELPALTLKLKKESYNLEKSDQITTNLHNELQQAKQDFVEEANKLSVIRENIAKELDNKVNQEIKALKLNNAQFKTKIVKNIDSDYSSYGVDQVTFLIQTNVDSDFKDLNKIASGGEMARFMLALKVILAEKQHMPTIIFDEIDIGVGGEVAHSIGKRLLALSKYSQVIVITHSHQVAALGDHHYKVIKTVENNKTNVSVATLNNDNRVDELARMISSDKIIENAKSIAKELLNKA